MTEALVLESTIRKPNSNSCSKIWRKLHHLYEFIRQFADALEAFADLPSVFFIQAHDKYVNELTHNVDGVLMSQTRGESRRRWHLEEITAILILKFEQLRGVCQGNRATKDRVDCLNLAVLSQFARRHEAHEPRCDGSFEGDRSAVGPGGARKIFFHYPASIQVSTAYERAPSHRCRRTKEDEKSVHVDWASFLRRKVSSAPLSLSWINIFRSVKSPNERRDDRRCKPALVFDPADNSSRNESSCRRMALDRT